MEIFVPSVIVTRRQNDPAEVAVDRGLAWPLRSIRQSLPDGRRHEPGADLHMREIDAVVGRKGLGTASCMSFCGQHGELVWT